MPDPIDTIEMQLLEAGRRLQHRRLASWRVGLSGRAQLLTASAVAIAVATPAVAAITLGPQYRHVDRQVTDQTVNAPSAPTTSRFSTFARPTTNAVVPIADQTRLKNALGGNASARHGAIAHADFSKTRSAPITGSDDRAYIVPSGSKMCVILPDPGDGFASTCQKLSDVEAGHGVLYLTPPLRSSDTTVWVAVMVPDGASDPTLMSADGSSTPLRTVGNIAATRATVGQQLHTAGGTISLG